MKTHVILVFALVLIVVGRTTGQDQPAVAEPKPPQDEKLRQELFSRVEKDQVARKAFIKLGRMGTGGRQAVVSPGFSDWGKLREIDRRNTAWLKEIVEKHGWPGKSLVGEDGAHSAWLLVQHADDDVSFQKKCLELLKVAVEEGEATPQDFAKFTDRVRIAEKKKQLYGTQVVQVGDKFKPRPIEDEEHVDDRRKEIGLPPLGDDLKAAEMMLNAKKEEKGE